jgi:hypothetical protein
LRLIVVSYSTSSTHLEEVLEPSTHRMAVLDLRCFLKKVEYQSCYVPTSVLKKVEYQSCFLSNFFNAPRSGGFNAPRSGARPVVKSRSGVKEVLEPSTHRMAVLDLRCFLKKVEYQNCFLPTSSPQVFTRPVGDRTAVKKLKRKLERKLEYTPIGIWHS